MFCRWKLSQSDSVIILDFLVCMCGCLNEFKDVYQNEVRHYVNRKGLENCIARISLPLSLSIYIYIDIYIHMYIYTNFVEHNGHFLSTYFLVDPFILLYWFYSIRRELIDIFSIIVYFCLLSVRLWVIIRGECITKAMQLLYVHYYFVRRRASGPLQCVAFTFKIVL